MLVCRNNFNCLVKLELTLIILNLIADEKVHLANQIHELVERYLRKLDQELHKFKMELEADHRGITEILEKRNVLIYILPQS